MKRPEKGEKKNAEEQCSRRLSLIRLFLQNRWHKKNSPRRSQLEPWVCGARCLCPQHFTSFAEVRILSVEHSPIDNIATESCVRTARSTSVGTVLSVTSGLRKVRKSSGTRPIPQCQSGTGDAGPQSPERTTAECVIVSLRFPTHAHRFPMSDSGVGHCSDSLRKSKTADSIRNPERPVSILHLNRIFHKFSSRR